MSIVTLILSTITVLCFSSPSEDDKAFLSASSVVVIAGQEVEISLNNSDNSNCRKWKVRKGPSYTVVSGGNSKDDTWRIKFNSQGTATIQCDTQYCKNVSHGAPCGRHGCKEMETLEINITIK